MNAAIVIGLGGLALLALAGQGKAASGMPQAIVDRMTAALATGNAAAIRTEAAALQAAGYSAQAADLYAAALRIEQQASSGQPPAALLAPKASTFSRNSIGPEVSSWQTYLRSQGYAAVTVDGVFGSQTEDATRAWQRSRGLAADGIVGPESLRASAMPTPAAAVAPPPPAPVPAPVAIKVTPVPAAPAAPAGPRILKRGMTGTDVAAWQTQLRAMGWTSVIVDGSFGELTDTKTKGWQRQVGITPDGIVGPETLRAAAAFVLAPAAPAVAAPAVLAPVVARTLKRGLSGPDVALWQAFLRSQGYSAVLADGVFGSQTEDATKAWQRSRGLASDGIVGPESLRASVTGAPAAAMAAPVVAAAAAVVAAAVAALPAFVRVLSKGASGTDVAAWQAFLRSQGYATVIADGVFGPATETASMAWQGKAGLTADGIVGKATWTAASSAVRVSGDHAFAADSPLPGIVAAAAPRLVDVSADRSLAAKLALHLMRSEPGTESRALVEQFQRSRGLNPTGAYGPGTAKALMRYGHVPPDVFYWPSQGSEREKSNYRNLLLWEAARDPQRAIEWNAAASRVSRARR